MLFATCIIVAAIGLFSVGMGVIEYRRMTPNAYRCLRCGAEFEKPSQRRFPRACPQCGARDWAT